MDAKWCFPSSNGGIKSGLNDSGIEMFKDNPAKFLAREICQNSLDAVIEGKTAVVEFRTFKTKREDFPDLAGFKDILKGCLEQSKSENNKKSEDFFVRALEIVDKKEIDMLRISDFNTTGLKDSDWDNLVNSSGISEKTDLKGGSFGIGKNAPFACSDLRTVLYSTLDTDKKQRSKGVSKLISYKLGLNEDMSVDFSQGTGYYGLCSAYNIKEINSMMQLDKAFSRQSSGTDIFVCGLYKTEISEFESTIVSEVLDGFMVAIWQNKLEVVVNDCKINKATLHEVIEKYKKTLSSNIVMCFELLEDESTDWVKIPVSLANIKIGDINFGFKIRFDGQNKISMIRSSGMKIFDKTGLCPSLRFVGIALAEGNDLNKFLRNMENPSHSKWEAQRSSDSKVAKEVLKKLFNNLAEKLNEGATFSFDEQIDIEGAGEYLPDELVEESRQSKNESQQENLNKLVDVDVKIIEKPTSVAHLETDEIGNDVQTETEGEGTLDEGYGYEGFDHLGSKPSGSGERDFDDVGLIDDDSSQGQELVSVKSKDIRIFCLNKKEMLYRLIFTPTISSPKGYIAIFKIAEQNEKMPAKIVYVKNNELEVFRNKVAYFNFVEGSPCKLDIKIDGEEYSTMEVKLYAYKG